MPTNTFFNLSEEKKNKIIKAANKEFARVPLEQASIKNIVEDAEIARGSFYQYFDSKEDLLKFLLEEEMEKVDEFAKQALKETSGDIFEVYIRMYDFLINQDLIKEDKIFHQKVLENIKTSEEDFYVLKKEGRSIGVDSLRGATSMLEGTATNANGKVLLIEDAEFMTVQASNALLKTLEEPPPNSFIMLSTGSPKSLLPTILSRTMKLTITTPSLSELNVFLNKELNTTNDYTLELLVSGLNPLQALEFIQGEDGKKLKDAVKAFNDVILRNALPSYFVQMVDKKLSPELTFALLFEVLKEAMRFQVGAYKKEESILQDKQVLQIIARIDPACLAQGLKKIMDLKKVPGLKVSMVNNLQLLTFMELLRGDEAYID